MIIKMSNILRLWRTPTRSASEGHQHPSLALRVGIVCLTLMLLGLLCVAGSGAQQPQPPAKADAGKADANRDAVKRLLDRAQEEYRIFFKEPKTVLECWAAVTFEMQVGKFDLAALHIEKLLKLPEKEGDEDLLKIEDAEGLNAFLRLKLVREWSKNAELEAEARKNAEILIDRVVAALEKRLSDPERIQRFIEGLRDNLPEVRAFSLYQLNRSSHRAAPLLAEALRNSKPQDQGVLKRALADLDAAAMPPLLELYRARDAKDASDIDFRLNLLWLARARLDKRVIPYLWQLTAAPQYPLAVRDQAKDTLALLMETTPDRLPPAKVALTQLAEQYYQRKVRFLDKVEVADREDPAKNLVMPGYKLWFLGEDGRIIPTPVVLKPDDARFEFGLRYSRQALEIDKSYVPAQALYLALVLEAEFTRKPFEGRLDTLLTESRPAAVQRLLGKIDLDLLTTVLRRAMESKTMR